MVNLKFGAFIFAVCLLLRSCDCDTTNPCTIQDTIATCESNENFKSLQNETTLTKLIVRSKELKRIDKDDLVVFVNLEEIDLSDSGLEEIDENAFAGLTKLHKINLAGNTKLKIPKDVSFLASNTLTCLNLSNTVVEQLNKTFAHLPLLENLDLTGTHVKDFSPLNLQEHLSKLVVTKTNDTKDLCSKLSIKEIIEKDADGTEIQLDCKPGNVEGTKDKEHQTPKIEEPPKTPKIEEPPTPKVEEPPKTPKIEEPPKTPKIEEPPTAPKIEEPPTTANKTEVTVVPTVATKTEEAKVTEATTVAAKNDSKELEENPAQNLTNKADGGAEHVHVPEKETTTVPSASTVVKSDSEYKENSDNGTIIVGVNSKDDKNEHPTENAEKASTENAKPVEENSDKTKNVEDEATVPPTIVEEDQADIKPERKANIESKEAPTDEKPRTYVEYSEDILPSTSNTSQSNGVNIVLGIILCVMVVGAIGFGYKYWKNRRSGYTHANTQDNDDEDKELQTIVAHRADPDQN